jgi:hypothetical protein
VLTARKANTFVGVSAGTNVTVNSNNNTLIGFGANTANFDMDNATAIGANALVEQPNALVLGSIGTRVGIGTTTPQASLDVRGNVFIANNVGTGFNVFPLAPLDVRGNVFIGVTQGNVPNATNAIFLGNDGGTDSNSFRLDADHNNLFIIGHSNPGSSAGAGIIFKTAVAQGGEVDTLSIEPNGHVKFPSLGAGDTTTALCRNSLGEIAFCGSSSLRYKSEVATFLGGLEIINRLRPISFLWNQSGTKDIGFGAEEVEKVEPLFTFKNDSGETEGVRYDRLGVLFVNAFKEEQEQIQTQQAQIDAQQERIRQQEERLEKLEKVLSGKSR